MSHHAIRALSSERPTRGAARTTPAQTQTKTRARSRPYPKPHHRSHREVTTNSRAVPTLAEMFICARERKAHTKITVSHRTRRNAHPALACAQNRARDRHDRPRAPAIDRPSRLWHRSRARSTSRDRARGASSTPNARIVARLMHCARETHRGGHVVDERRRVCYDAPARTTRSLVSARDALPGCDWSIEPTPYIDQSQPKTWTWTWTSTSSGSHAKAV